MPQQAFRFKVVSKPDIVKRYRRRRVRVKNAMTSVVSKATADRNDFVSYWESQDRPRFTFFSEDTGNKIRVGIVKQDEPAESATLSVWELLDRGTNLRFMQLSEDWSSKTAPGNIEKFAGSGHTTGINMKNVRPGIAPREFDEEFNADTNQKMLIALRKALSG